VVVVVVVVLLLLLLLLLIAKYKHYQIKYNLVSGANSTQGTEVYKTIVWGNLRDRDRL